MKMLALMFLMLPVVAFGKGLKAGDCYFKKPVESSFGKIERISFS